MRAPDQAGIQSDSDRQHAFLLRLGDAHASLHEPAAIMQTSARLLCEYLDTDRTLYLGIEDIDGERQCHVRGQYNRRLPPLAGRFDDDASSLGWVSGQLRLGQPVVVSDAARDPRLEPEVRRAWLATGVLAIVAVPLLRNGREVVHFGCHHQSPRDWSAADVALIAEVAERTRAAVERALAETALRASEAKYRAIVDSINEGIALIEAVGDASDPVSQLVFREVNPAFAAHLGERRIVGRSVAEVMPCLAAPCINALSRIRRSGVPVRADAPLAVGERWFELRFAPVGARDSGWITMVWSDITERRQAEYELRQREQRHEFLLRLTDALRPVSDPQTMQALAMRVLAQHLGVSRAEYFDIDATSGTATLRHDHPFTPQAGGCSFSLSDFGAGPRAAYAAGKTYVRTDTAAPDPDPEPEPEPEPDNAGPQGAAAIPMRAMVGAPILKDGIFRAVLTVADANPREWSPVEVALVEETAERVWTAVRRAQAEQAQHSSELRYRSLFDRIDEGVAICAALRDGDTKGGATGRVVDARYLELNPAYERQTGLDRSRALGTLASAVFPLHHPSLMGIVDRVLRTGRAERVEHLVPDLNRWFSLRVAPFGDADGFSVFYADITETRNAAEALRDREQRLRSFGEASSDALWVRNAATMALEYLSPASERVFGVQRGWSDHGDGLQDWLDLILPEDRPAARLALERMQQGERQSIDLCIRRPSDGELRLLRNTGFPIRDPMGRVTRIGGVSRDITEEQQTARRMEVMVAELQHRTRNLLGVVRSVADRTLAGSRSLDEFSYRFRDRLGALARVNRLLSRLSDGDRITFDELLRVELAAHGVSNGSDYGGRLLLRGPNGIRLRSSMVQPLALGLHELATNALKYGALSQPEGRLRVEWWLENQPGDAGARGDGGDDPDGGGCGGVSSGGERLLRVEWRESGVKVARPDQGPGPRPPSGSGRELIERALPYQLKAETSYELTPDGVHCTITLPIPSLVAGSGSGLMGIMGVMG
ncbi:PAS domain-containing protein [Paracoccus alkenifer]|uniref:histidine kinase n=1 Tax=Paracoccus alkenifer TaxID=65735 RepID=A0A1H6LGE0_9RHOB|nr:PAS domain-containing protein [Paracoccus alkenifer]SEH87633.1 PAS domain S-box-containing protein [Paracoccus alkenifer]